MTCGLEGVWKCECVEGWPADVYLEITKKKVNIGCETGGVPEVKNCIMLGARVVHGSPRPDAMPRIGFEAETGEGAKQSWELKLLATSQWRHEWRATAVVDGKTYSLTSAAYVLPPLIWSVDTSQRTPLPAGEWDTPTPIFTTLSSSPDLLKVSYNGSWVSITNYQSGPDSITFAFYDWRCKVSLRSQPYISGVSPTDRWSVPMKLHPGVRFEKPIFAVAPPAYLLSKPPRQHLVSSFGGILIKRNGKNNMEHILGKPRAKDVPVGTLTPSQKKKLLLEQGFTLPSAKVCIPELQQRPPAKHGRPYRHSRRM